jgi:hypothetical protein
LAEAGAIILQVSFGALPADVSILRIVREDEVDVVPMRFLTFTRRSR